VELTPQNIGNHNPRWVVLHNVYRPSWNACPNSIHISDRSLFSGDCSNYSGAGTEKKKRVGDPANTANTNITPERGESKVTVNTNLYEYVRKIMGQPEPNENSEGTPNKPKTPLKTVPDTRFQDAYTSSSSPNVHQRTPHNVNTGDVSIQMSPVASPYKGKGKSPPKDQEIPSTKVSPKNTKQQ